MLRSELDCSGVPTLSSGKLEVSFGRIFLISSVDFTIFRSAEFYFVYYSASSDLNL